MNYNNYNYHEINNYNYHEITIITSHSHLHMIHSCILYIAHHILQKCYISVMCTELIRRWSLEVKKFGHYLVLISTTLNNTLIMFADLKLVVRDYTKLLHVPAQ